MTTDRPAPTAPAFEIAPPEMSDEQMDTDPFVRVLLVRWDQRVVTLASSAAHRDVDDPVTHWPIPRLPADVIYAWVPTILPLLNSMLGKRREDTDGVLRLHDSKLEADAVFEAVDEFTRTWCGRPAPRGNLARCTKCHELIEKSAERTDGFWMRRVPPGPRTITDEDIECPVEPMVFHAFVSDISDPGSIRVDYRPYHDLELTAHGELFTGRCDCGHWTCDTPSNYTPLLTAFDKHANTPLPHPAMATSPNAPFDT